MQYAEQLKQNYLPEYEAFYSKLKACNILNEEYENWEKTDKTKSKPETGREKYLTLKQVWEKQNMKIFKIF